VGESLIELTDERELIAGLVERLGRDPREAAVRGFAGAVDGVMISLLRTWADIPDIDGLASMDDAMVFLEAGLPLEQGAV
jgi:hypothetical protein